MSKISKFVNRRFQRFVLSQNKAVTNIGLRVFTHNRKIKGIKQIKDISYGKSKLQKYDIYYSTNIKNENNPNNLNLPIVFYVHGGSWCGGDKYGYTMFCEKLAKHGYIVVNANYRLMPKVDIKTCVADIILAIRHFIKNSCEILHNEKLDASTNISANFDNVFLVGDSAGAHIVSLIAGKQTQKKLRLPIKISALGLYYGVFNFENIVHDPSPIMTSLDKYWKSIYDDTHTLYASISTTNFVSEHFPSTFMTSGEIDKLHFQSEIMYRMLKYNNVDVKYLSFEKSRQDGRHAFLNAPFLKSAKEAFAALLKFFEERIN